jgi:uncharacterized protein YprB with RNaseH-like and TPR domain
MLRDKLNNLSSDIIDDDNRINDTSGNERYSRLAECLNGKIIYYDSGAFIKIFNDHGDTYAHGRKMLIDLKQGRRFRRKHFYFNDKDISIPESKLLFFDMETTGLGGVGVVPFLIGFGSVKKNGFQVRQYFLPDYPDEEAMLTAVREEIKDDSVIVSYNGKSFDLPILTDRFILHRIDRNLKIADHIDLLHCARRMFRRRLKDCTLTNIEREILDYHRQDDIPGYLIPSIYFNWLNYDETEYLAGVVEHNRMDIISLYFFMHHLADIGTSPEDELAEPDDILSLARIINSGKEYRNVHRTLESFNNITSAYNRHDIMFFHSIACKRAGEWEKAVDLWKKIVESVNSETYTALIELAKYYEHRIKDLPVSLDYARKAQKLCPDRPADKSDLLKRIARLKRKMNR